MSLIHPETETISMTAPVTPVVTPVASVAPVVASLTPIVDPVAPVVASLTPIVDPVAPVVASLTPIVDPVASLTPIVTPVDVTNTYCFADLPTRSQDNMINSLRQLADSTPYTLSPFGTNVVVERIWLTLIMIKRLRGIPLVTDEQRWWASRQEQLLEPADMVFLQLVADQWGITRDKPYLSRLEAAIDNTWIRPDVRKNIRPMIFDTYYRMCSVVTL
jgi:hypothetical protein